MEKSHLGLLSNEIENHFLCSPTKVPFFFLLMDVGGVLHLT